MSGPSSYPTTLGRLTQLEIPICLFFNRVQNRLILRFFSAISWLGNGPYYAVIFSLLWVSEGSHALAGTYHGLMTGVVCLALYKTLKHRTARPRPFDSRPGFNLTIAPLDQYSFPSGHTLHAVAFTLVLSAYDPVLFWISVPFAGLVALSRLVLGLHYPTDVVAGAALGSTIALLILQIELPV